MGAATKPREAPTTTSSPTPRESGVPATDRRVAGLLSAWAPPGLPADDRSPIDPEIRVGRSSQAGWCIRDDQLSRTHFAVVAVGARLLLRDEGSRNGTFVNGARVESAREVSPGDVIRAGSCVFVVTPDLAGVGPPGERAGFGIAGRFHAVPIVRQLRLAARTGRHILLHGETGTGKELTARALHAILADFGRTGPLAARNAAQFAGDDDAVATLFGVRRGAFTGAEPRVGALETAHGGTLFLDEVHNLPPRVQRSLLRFAEDGLLHRVGEPSPHVADVRLVLGINLDVASALASGRLAHDLAARLHRVSLPPLRDRRADVPSILLDLLRRRLPAAADEAMGALDATWVDRICRADYRDGNVRELDGIAAVATATLAEGTTPSRALRAALAQALPSENGGIDPVADPSASAYERHRPLILATYAEVRGNLSRLEDELRSRGLACNRRWLSVYLDRWGARAVRRRR
jgi:DNA-binding NtrC family response regulator